MCVVFDQVRFESLLLLSTNNNKNWSNSYTWYSVHAWLCHSAFYGLNNCTQSINTLPATATATTAAQQQSDIVTFVAYVCWTSDLDWVLWCWCCCCCWVALGAFPVCGSQRRTASWAWVNAHFTDLAGHFTAHRCVKVLQYRYNRAELLPASNKPLRARVYARIWSRACVWGAPTLTLNNTMYK